jgi:hypothetical protein
MRGTVAIRHGATLDWRYIERLLRPLAEAKEDPAILETLARLRGLPSADSKD